MHVCETAYIRLWLKNAHAYVCKCWHILGQRTRGILCVLFCLCVYWRGHWQDKQRLKCACVCVCAHAPAKHTSCQKSTDSHRALQPSGSACILSIFQPSRHHLGSFLPVSAHYTQVRVEFSHPSVFLFHSAFQSRHVHHSASKIASII